MNREAAMSGNKKSGEAEGGQIGGTAPSGQEDRPQNPPDVTGAAKAGEAIGADIDDLNLDMHSDGVNHWQDEPQGAADGAADLSPEEQARRREQGLDRPD
jgi:hypothetical protein